MRWRDVFELARAPAALSVPGDLVAGAAAAGTLGPRTAGLAGSSVLLYWAGMAANDWADRDLDAVERPERPIPSGRVAAGAALGIAAGLTAAGVAVAGLTGGRRALAVAAPLAGAVWAYDLGLKNTKAGPAAMATCRALDVLLGAAGGRLRKALFPAATVFAHTYTVTALSRAEVHGSSRGLPATTLAGTVAVAAAAGTTRRGPTAGTTRADATRADATRADATRADATRAGATGRRPVAAALAAWYAKTYGEAQLRALDKPTAGNIRAAVGAGILNLPTLQGALAARAGAPVAGLAVAAAAPLARRLSRRLSPT